MKKNLSISVSASDGDVSLSQGVMFSSALGSSLFVCLFITQTPLNRFSQNSVENRDFMVIRITLL